MIQTTTDPYYANFMKHSNGYYYYTEKHFDHIPRKALNPPESKKAAFPNPQPYQKPYVYVNQYLW